MHLYIACEDFLQSLVICQQTRNIAMGLVLCYTMFCVVCSTALHRCNLVFQFSDSQKAPYVT